MAKLITKEQYCYFDSIADYIKPERFMVIDNDAEYQEFKTKVDDIIDHNFSSHIDNLRLCGQYFGRLYDYNNLPFWKRWFADKPMPPVIDPPTATQQWIEKTHCMWDMPMHVPEQVYLDIVHS